MFFSLFLFFTFFYLFLRKNANALPTTLFQTLPRKITFRLFLHRLIIPCFFFALVCTALSIHYDKPTSSAKITPREAFYLLIDTSSSMNEQIKNAKDNKMTVTKNAAISFIENHSDSLLGILTFARIPTMQTPLTIDSEALIANVQSINPVKDKEDDGTAIGYAIFKTANIIIATQYFAHRGKMKKSTENVFQIPKIIVLTDGLHSPHPDDRTHPFRFISTKDALKVAQEEEIEVYIINIDPTVKQLINDQGIETLAEATKKTGGNLFFLDYPDEINRVLDKIAPAKQKKILSPDSSLFLSLSIIFLLFAITLETLIARTVP